MPVSVKLSNHSLHACINNSSPFPPFTPTDHGLFCMARVEKNLQAARNAPNAVLSFLKVLEFSLSNFESEANLPFTSTCPHCSFVLASFFINYLYWDTQRNVGTQDVPWFKGFFTSRPQDGYVWPLVQHQGRRNQTMDESVKLNFVRGRITDSVS